MIIFKYDNALIPKSKVLSTAKRLASEIKKLKEGNEEYSFAKLPIDTSSFRVVQAAVALKRRLHPQLIVVVGIGGSNLGTIAVQEALLGKNWNLHNSPRILYADTVDPDTLKVISEEM